MSIFSRIIRGEIPCHKVYEDAWVFAFLDINPLSKGHTLVIPKEPAATLGELSDDAGAALGRALPRICRAIQAVTGCPGYNLLQNNGEVANQVVMHAHIHVIPRYEGDRLGAGLELVWRPTKLDAGEGGELARRLSAAIGA